MSPAVHVYCGPTITFAEVTAIIPAAVTHPPVQHGDLLAADLGTGDTVAIIDGLFHHRPAIRHKEILSLIACGVIVVGAASMGALRAAELHRYGMTGAGAIFAAYRDGILDADDEVAVAVDGDHRAVSEAMVDVRDALAQAARDGAIDQKDADALADRARSVHYADRTWAAIAAAARPDMQQAMTRFVQWRDKRGAALVPAKRRDARQALQMIAAGIPPLPDATRSWADTRWGNLHLKEWRAQFSGRHVSGIHVPFQAVMRHQQIYDPAFPARWRQHVMSWITGRSGPDAETSALAAASAGGVAISDLSLPQIAYWLTVQEITELPDAEQMARILTRAVPQDPTAAVFPATAEQAGDLIHALADSERAAAAATRRNAAVARTGPDRDVMHLRASKIRAHLATVWSVSPADDATLTAAARDRGFGSIGAAVSAARFFFLMSAEPTAALALTGPAAS